MKILDRYILRQFIIPVMLCLLTFCMMFVVFDLFEHLSDFLKSRPPLLQVVEYYLCVLPTLAVYIVPISILLGLLYSLWQMARHNELTAMRAGGVGLLRIALPILLVGASAAVLVAVVQELIVPKSAYWAEQFITRQEEGEDLSRRFTYGLTYKNERHNRNWAIRRFDLITYEMQGVQLVQQRMDGSDMETIHAAEARFYDNRWWFFDAMLQKFDLSNNPLGPPEKISLMEMREVTETPNDFINEVKNPIFMSALELWKFVKSHVNLSNKVRARYMVDMHARLAMPWTCLVVVLFGLPFGIHTARQGAFAGIMMALVTFFGFYVIMLLSQWYGKQEYLPPLLAAWLPNVIFTGLGLFLMRKVR